jgi:oxygen-independent coproporphyrinogen-3 oxidase
MTIFSAYLHIPFCRRRCYYCDFPITVLGDGATYKVSPWIKEYVDVLGQEILITPQFQNADLQTIFFGGGTPSLLPVNELERIINILARHFGIAKDAEISLEIDPATFTLAQLMDYQKLGINRFSLGVQAFQDNLLEICGRSHCLKDIEAAMDLIKQAEITNFSIDLISGLPHQTMKQWEFSLKNAIKLQPQHISCYDLVLEAVTAFGKKYQLGDQPLPPDEVSADMYRLASEMLRDAGYFHYEISNYAKSGYECRHNQVYWDNRPYYGFGMGAASYTQQKRFTRPRNRKEYFIWVENLIENKGIIDAPKLTKTDVLLETLMLGLRLAKGVNLEKIGIQFGEEVVKQIINCTQRYVNQGWVSMDEDRHYLRLTDPEGFLYSNVVLSELFSWFNYNDK